MTRGWVFWAVIAAAVAIAWLTAAPPPPRPASAPPTAFSAERAMADVRLVAREPHPIGSAANAAVRDRLMARMTALGLEPVVRPGYAFREDRKGVAGANVENILGRLPGTEPGLPAVLLMAHYDSVPGSPGAADDAAGVAAILESLRALKAIGPAPRTVLVLFTDGEETGLFGAEAFWKHGPPQPIAAVVNLEARGSAGPAFMFETGPRNAGVVALYGEHVARPAANSLSTWVYDRMPNGSDFTVAKKAGLPGVNIAMIGRPFDYHSATATPENLSQASLQHMGEQTLAMADALRRDGPGVRGPDLVYSDLFGRWQLGYPAWAGWLLIGAAAALGLIALRFGGAPERRLDLARGAGLFLLLLLWPALAAHTAYRVAPVGEAFYQSPTVAQFGLFFAGMALLCGGVGLAMLGGFIRGGGRWLLAGSALVLGVACSLLGGFDVVGAVLAVGAAVVSALVLGRPAGKGAAALGLLGAAVILALVLQALAPQTAFLAAWPALTAAAAVALLAAGRLPAVVRVGGAALLATAGLAWVFAMAVPLFDGLGLTSPELLGLFSALAGLLTAPFAGAWLGGRRSMASAAALMAAGMAVLAVVALRDPASARTPAPSHVLYVADAAGNRAWMASTAERLDPWSRRVLESAGEPRRAPFEAALLDDAWAVAAPPVETGARVEVALRAASDLRSLEIRGAGDVRDLRLGLTFSVPVTVVGVNGERGLKRAVRAGEELRLRWFAPGTAPIQLAFTADGPGAVAVRHAALADGWPAGAKPLPPRPPEVMPAASSDSTMTIGRTTLTW